MVFSVLGVFAIVLFAFLITLVNSWSGKDRYPDEPLYSVKTQELCSFHEWSRGAFLSYKEMEQVKTNPLLLEAKKTHFCRVCGYVPALEKMVKPGFLVDINKQIETSELLQKKLDKINKLSQEFYSSIVKDLDASAEELIYMRAGYDAHKTFIDNLPQLLLIEETTNNTQNDKKGA